METLTELLRQTQIRLAEREEQLVRANNRIADLENRLAQAAPSSEWHPSEESYRSLFQNSDTRISLIDADGYYLYLNRLAIESFDMPGETITGKTVHEVLPPDQADMILADVRHVIQHNQGIVLEPEMTIDGKPVWFRTIIQPVQDNSGKPYAAFLHTIEITDKKLAEQALKTSEERYRSLLNSSDASIATFDESGYLLYANEHAIQTLGLTRETITGRHMVELFPPVIANYQLTEIQEVMRTGIGVVHESLNQVNGKERWYRTSIQPVRDAFGQITAGLINATDITRFKENETALRQNEAYLRSLIDSQTAFNIRVDLNGNFTYCNQRYVQQMGSTLEELIGTSSLNMVVPENHDHIHEAVTQCMAQVGTPVQVELGKQTRDNRLLWTLWEFIAIQDEHGMVNEIQCVGFDLTKQKQAEAALKTMNEVLEQRVLERTIELERTRDRIEAIFNHSGDGILLVDVNHGIQQANYAFEALFNVPVDSYLGKKLADFFEPEYGDDFEVINQEVAAYHQTKRIEARAKRPDGTVFNVEISIAPVNRSDRTVTNLVCIIRDVSERKQAEAVLQSYTAEIQDLYNNAPAGYHSLDRDGIITQINDMELNWLGYVREEVVGQLNITDLLVPSSIATFREQFPTFKERGWLKDLELEFKRKDGSTFQVLLSATAIYDENGQFSHSRSTIFDNTGLLKAQQMIAEERNLLRTVIDTVPDFIYVKDSHHRMVLNNAAHTRSLGMDNPADAVGKTDFEMFSSEMAAKFQADEEQIFRTGFPLLNSEERTIGQDGSEIWALTTKVPLRNLEGKVTGLVGITHDVSQMKASEEALRNSEKQLQASQERLQLVLDTIPVRVFWKDRRSAYLGCNRLFAEDAGLTHPSAIIGKQNHDLLWETSETADYLADDLRVIETGIPRLDYEETVETISGKKLIVQTSKLPLLDEENAVIGVLGIYIDITARRQMEKALDQKYQEEQEIQSYLKALHEITLRLTRAETLDDFYRAVVEQGLECFGFERMGLLLYDKKDGKAAGTYGTDEHGIVVDEHHLRLDPASLTGIFKRILDRNERFVFDEEIGLFANLQPIGTGQNAVAALWNGEILGWLAIDNGVHHQPITRSQLDILGLYALTTGALMARKRAEFALQKTKDQLQSILDYSTASIFMKDLEGRLLLLNRSAEADLEMNAEQVVGKLETDLFPSETTGYYQNHDLKVKESAIPLSYEETIKEHTYWVTKFPIFDHQNRIYAIGGIATDITSRKLFEESLERALGREQELGELKSRFVSMASHEFRTPLAAILSTTESLIYYRDRMDQEQINNRLDRIRQQVMYMAGMTEDMLQLTRLQGGRTPFKPETSDLDALCREIIEEFDTQVEHRGRIVYRCAMRPVTAYFDRQLMRQVISNIISNALKYSSVEKSVQISLALMNAQIIFTVKDEGIGIPAEDLNHLFEHFHRAPNVGTISGTGLGLSIAQQAVVMHGGAIIPESEEGVGTTFTVVIPLRNGEGDLMDGQGWNGGGGGGGERKK